MKIKTYYPLFFCLIIASCQNNSKKISLGASDYDHLEDIIHLFLNEYKEGLEPSSSMAEIKKYNRLVSEYFNKETNLSLGLFSEEKNEEFLIKKVYEREANSSNRLRRSELVITILNDTNPTNPYLLQGKINERKYINTITKELPFASQEKKEGQPVWVLSGCMFSVWFTNNQVRLSIQKAEVY